MRMERICAPRYLDELEIRTWVSSMARVRSDRNYEVRRRADGKEIGWYGFADQGGCTRITG